MSEIEPVLKPPIRLLLSDIDGTLLRPDHSLTAVTVEAVKRLREAGVHFAVASSRPPRAMRPIIEALGVDLPTIAFNGGNVIHPDGRLLAAHRIPTEGARTALRLFMEHAVSIWVFADDQWLLLETEGAYVEHERATLGYDPVLVESFEPWLGRVDKMVASSADFELLKTLERTLNPLIEGVALAARSQAYYLDVTAVEANKGTALVTLAEYLDIPLASTAAIGDGGNDVAMFHRAGLGIVMGQAEASVAEQADEITGSNLEDGVAQAIERFILKDR